MRALELARKDLVQIFRDKRSLLFLALMPLVFTLFFGFTMGKPAASTEDTRLKIGLIDQDGGALLSRSFKDLLSASTTVQPVEVADPGAVEQMVRSGILAAALTIPSGFTAGSIQGNPPSLYFVVDERSEAGQTARSAIQTTTTRISGSVHMAVFSADAYVSQTAFASEAARLVFIEDAVQRSMRAWQSPNAVVRMTGPSLASDNQDAQPANPYAQFSPGMMVMFAVFGLSQTAMVMVIERRSGALARLLTTPMRRFELIGGHILGMFVVVFAQQLFLVGFGQVALKLDYLSQPLATLLLMVALSLWVSTLGLMIGTLARGEEQVTLYSMIAMFLFSALGGTWFPLEMTGKVFSTIGHLMPTAWAMDGFQNIAMRGLGLSSVLLPVGVLLFYTLAFFGLALWRFKFE